jgi:dolichol-phosphate mannosyltransferase
MPKIAVVIPCYRVKKHVLHVIASIGPSVDKIYLVDDCCPELTSKHIKELSKDSRITYIEHAINQGVGGAVISGYMAAVSDGMDIVVKIDGDGQMNPALIPDFVKPIIEGKADYTKGNRFFDLEHINRMPKMRLLGNSILSFMNKISTGYWDIFDPTNGFTAIHSEIIKKIAFSRVSKRYFFESDMLFRLNILKAVVIDIPMDAFYGDEKSGLKISSVIWEFLSKHCVNFYKRVFYNYYLRDMSVASFELPLGISLLIFGILHGLTSWYTYSHMGIVTPLGTIMISSLALLFGLQFLLAFLAYDISSVPRRVIHR